MQRAADNASQLERFHEALLALWDHGRQIILAWSLCDEGFDLIVVPHWRPAEILDAPPSKAAATIGRLMAGRKRLTQEQLRDNAGILGVSPMHLPLEGAGRLDSVNCEAIERTVRRFSISSNRAHAVFLVDIVGFSLLAPLQQMTQLNGLVYSLNMAQEKLQRRNVHVDFGRSSTGDGFYVWNRRGGRAGNTALYHLMHLFLAHNALDRGGYAPYFTSQVKCVFHVGAYFTYYLSGAQLPACDDYIVGDVTVELARIMEHALPGQVLVGDFRMPTGSGGTAEPPAFIDRLQASLDLLHGIDLNGERLASIKCYLTGEGSSLEGYSIACMQLKDKHGMLHRAYNAKINIYREGPEPIYLGLQHKDLGKPALPSRGTETAPA